MTLTFNPALQTTTALPVVPGGHASFRFSTSFASRDAYERARKDGSRLEMWTNLPVGGKSGKEWHALAFSYPDVDVAATASATEDADDDEKVFVVSPATSNIAHKRDNTAVVLDLTLTNARLGAVYSFTYRLVRASGAIEWLGAYGQNGDLVIQEKDVRLTLAEGCRFEQGDIVSRYAGAGAVTVATLDMLTDWVCWSLNADGKCKGPYSGLSLPRLSAALLVPRPSNFRLVSAQPLLLKASQGALSITANGDLILHECTRLTTHNVDKASCEILQDVLPGYSISFESGFAVLASTGTDGPHMPTSLSFIAISREAWYTHGTDVRLTDTKVRAIIGSEHSDAAILNSSISAVGTWKAGEDLVIRVSAPGAHCILAPVYSLASTKEEGPVTLALLSPFASAQVEVVEEVQASALLTPPPSPPPVSRPIATKLTSSPSSTLRHSPPPSILQVLPELAEPSPEEAEVFEPLTPMSPEPQESKEELPEDDEAPETAASLILRRIAHPTRTGFIRFLLAFVAWLVRPALDKIYGFFGGNLLLWIACTFSSNTTHADAGAIKTERAEPIVEFVEDDTPNLDTAQPVTTPQDESDGLPHEKSLSRTYSELTVSDGSTMICEAEDEEEDQVDQKDPSVTSPEVIPPLHNLAPLAIPSRQPPTITKPYFVVDTRSDIVSLLAWAKPQVTASPALDVVIDGERSHPPVKSTLLSNGAYLLELQLPTKSAKLQLAFGQ